MQQWLIVYRQCPALVSERTGICKTGMILQWPLSADSHMKADDSMELSTASFGETE